MQKTERGCNKTISCKNGEYIGIPRDVFSVILQVLSSNKPLDQNLNKNDIDELTSMCAVRLCAKDDPAIDTFRLQVMMESVTRESDEKIEAKKKSKDLECSTLRYVHGMF